MIGRPIDENCVSRLDRDDAFADQLNNNVLRAHNYQWVAGNPCFANGLLNCSRVVDRERAFPVDCDGDGLSLAGPQPFMDCQPQE